MIVDGYRKVSVDNVRGQGA